MKKVNNLLLKNSGFNIVGHVKTRMGISVAERLARTWLVWCFWILPVTAAK